MPTRTNGVTAQSLAALDPLLRVTQDITAVEEVRRRAAADIALFFLPHYLGRRTKKRKKFPADEFGFAVDPKRARELRDLDLELGCLVVGVSRGGKQIPRLLRKKSAPCRLAEQRSSGSCKALHPRNTSGKTLEQDGALSGTRLLDRDKEALRHLARRRANKNVLTAEEDAEEAHLTARVAAFLNGPEEVARKHLGQLEEKDRAFGNGWGRP